MANDLTTASTPSLPQQAKLLLADNDGWQNGHPTTWRAPAQVSPAEREALERSIPALEAGLRPCTTDQIMQALTELRLHKRNAPGEKGLPVVLEGFRRHLEDVPPDILWQAKEAWMAQSPFWPDVSDLVGLAKPELERRKAMLSRAKRLLTRGGRRTRYVPTDEERERFADGFRKLAETMRAAPDPS